MLHRPGFLSTAGRLCDGADQAAGWLIGNRPSATAKGLMTAVTGCGDSSPPNPAAALNCCKITRMFANLAPNHDTQGGCHGEMVSALAGWVIIVGLGGGLATAQEVSAVWAARAGRQRQQRRNRGPSPMRIWPKPKAQPPDPQQASVRCPNGARPAVIRPGGEVGPAGTPWFRVALQPPPLKPVTRRVLHPWSHSASTSRQWTCRRTDTTARLPGHRTNRLRPLRRGVRSLPTARTAALKTRSRRRESGKTPSPGGILKRIPGAKRR